MRELTASEFEGIYNNYWSLLKPEDQVFIENQLHCNEWRKVSERIQRDRWGVCKR